MKRQAINPIFDFQKIKYSKRNEAKLTDLNFYCLLYIGQYLSIDDVLNLAAASSILQDVAAYKFKIFKCNKIGQTLKKIGGFVETLKFKRNF